MIEACVVVFFYGKLHKKLYFLSFLFGFFYFSLFFWGIKLDPVKKNAVFKRAVKQETESLGADSEKRSFSQKVLGDFFKS
ncbi:MAG: hypothetical protein RR499_04690, partial [Mucinivorans sp.]